VTREFELDLADGRTLHCYDTGGDGRVAVLWHHGTPNIGAPPEPLFAAADALGLRWISYDRPGYGGSTLLPGRQIATAAQYAAALADHLGIDRFATMGHSGGGPHAVACGALLPRRVFGVVSVSGLAPYGAAGLDWFGGMCDSGVASLQAALEGRAAKVEYESSGVEYDPEFVAADDAALEGDWAWLGSVVGPAMANGPGGLVDDDVAYVSPWGVDPTSTGVPLLLIHGGLDRVVPDSHSRWLAGHCATAQLWSRPQDGHISALGAAEDALQWLRERAG
jgi:pimeloyl-ACP methyl ester carboxylesterase